MVSIEELLLLFFPYFLLQRSIALPFFSFGKTKKFKRASYPLLYSFGWKINHTNSQKRTLEFIGSSVNR